MENCACALAGPAEAINCRQIQNMIAISIATKNDIPKLCALLNRAYRGAPSRQGWTTEADIIQGDFRTDEEHLDALMSRPESVFLKAVDAQGNLNGCVFLEKQVDKLYLGMLAVAPEVQASGIGKLLMREAESRANQMACRTIFMEVISVRHELIAWYERQEFRKTDLRKPFASPQKFGIPVQPLEFVILEKRLDPE